jgi:hypothetical protein
LDRRKVRASFERRFTSTKMAGKYISCYKRVLAEVRPDQTTRTNVTVRQIGPWDAPHLDYTPPNLPPTGTAQPIREVNPNGRPATHVINDDWT